MNPYEIIKKLAAERGISVRELEKRLGFSNGYFSKWKTVSPNSEGLAKVADYFDVTIDYLLGRDVPSWANEQDIIDLEKLLDKNVSVTYNGEEFSQEEIDVVRNVLSGIYWRKMAEKKKEQ